MSGAVSTREELMAVLQDEESRRNAERIPDEAFTTEEGLEHIRKFVSKIGRAHV